MEGLSIFFAIVIIIIGTVGFLVKCNDNNDDDENNSNLSLT